MNLRNLVIAATLALPLAASATSGPALNDSIDPSVAAVVEMTPPLNFTPPELRISAGDTVEFRNLSGFAHTVSTVPDNAAESATVQLPAGATAFDSGPIKAGDVFRRVYRYFCDPHHGTGMIGTIVVEGGEAMSMQMNEGMTKAKSSVATYSSGSSYSSGLLYKCRTTARRLRRHAVPVR